MLELEDGIEEEGPIYPTSPDYDRPGMRDAFSTMREMKDDVKGGATFLIVLLLVFSCVYFYHTGKAELHKRHGQVIHYDQYPPEVRARMEGHK